MHLYLVRHGQSYVNLAEWEEGNVDAGLTDLGRQQASALAEWISKTLPAIDALYTSTMCRARETADALAEACRCTVQSDDRLREIGNNRSDHTAWPSDALPKEYADYWATERPFASVAAVAGGESLMHFRTRVGAFIEQTVAHHRDQTVVAVCHGGVMDAVFDHVFNVGPWRRCEIWTYNTGITYLEYVDHPEREVWRLHYHNRVDHLRGIQF